MANETIPEKIQALLDPSLYDHATGALKLVQTHISYVILADEFVYKFKKSVDFGFLDFSTLEKRRYCCEQELLLNRRLCPDIYLNLVTLTKQQDRFALNGDGEVVEYGIRMIRMPEDRMMEQLIQAGKIDKSHMDALVAVLIPFYEKAEHSAYIDGFGTADGVAVNVLENFSQTEQFIETPGLSRARFELISRYASEFLAQSERFAARIAQRRIRDCHGDLYSANICLADKVYIYDCIEFNQRFRYCDIASDVAFLAMDLDFHGLTELSDYFIERFCLASNDQTLPEMLNFYKCYRAYVRGKIGMFTASDPGVHAQVRKNCLESAEKYFRLAEHYTVG